MSNQRIYRWIYYLLVIISQMIALPIYVFWRRIYSGNRMIDISVNKLSRLELIGGISVDKKLHKSACCSGGHRLVFQTNSKSILVLALYKTRSFLPHMVDVGISGLDLYQNNEDEDKWITSISPDNKMQMYMKRKVNLPTGANEYILYLPLYAGLKKLRIIATDGEDIREKVCRKSPIVVYGSSISQGCAASRSGLSYPNILAGYFKRNIINYGFSESARGQAEIIDRLSQIDTNLIIMEYDHNADLTTLKKTHLNTYKIIRKNNKTALIIYMGRFSGCACISKEELKEREKVIKATVRYAHDLGDQGVELIIGDLQTGNDEAFFVDDRHPNDRGMIAIANEIISVVERKNGNYFDKKTN